MPDEDVKPKPEATLYTVVYINQVLLADGVPGAELRMVHGITPSEYTLDPGPRYFTEKNVRKAGMFIGGVYTLEGNADMSSVFLTTAKYQGLWPNEKDRQEWKALERAFQIEQRLRKQMKDDKADNALLTALQPIRKAWQKTDSVGRLALEVQVLAYLRGQQKPIK